jgi:hypothetical protein
MKKYILLFIFSNVFFSVIAQENRSPKPEIIVNGNDCNIGYEEYTCLPAYCDTVTITEGDSIEFCTGAYTVLNTPGYYIEWNFTGSSMPVQVDSAVTSTPVCYYPQWLVAGNYDVDIYYRGMLAICCCNDVPSHWVVHVTVLTNVGVSETQSEILVSAWQSPGSREISITCSSPNAQQLQIFDVTGQLVHDQNFTGTANVSAGNYLPGLYFIRMYDPVEKRTATQKLIIR